MDREKGEKEKVTSSRGHPDIFHSGDEDMVLSQHTAGGLSVTSSGILGNDPSCNSVLSQ